MGVRAAELPAWTVHRQEARQPSSPLPRLNLKRGRSHVRVHIQHGPYRRHLLSGHRTAIDRCIRYIFGKGRGEPWAFLEIDEPLREAIHAGEGEQALLRIARQRSPGINTDGRRRILDGETSLEEVLRVTAVN